MLLCAQSARQVPLSFCAQGADAADAQWACCTGSLVCLSVCRPWLAILPPTLGESEGESLCCVLRWALAEPSNPRCWRHSAAQSVALNLRLSCFAGQTRLADADETPGRRQAGRAVSIRTFTSRASVSACHHRPGAGEEPTLIRFEANARRVQFVAEGIPF